MRMRKPLPCLNYLKECFEWDIEGVLIWKERPISHFKSKQGHTYFNNHYAGKRAGSLSSCGYIKVNLNKTNFLIHRILWKLYHKKEPPFIIDHVNEDKTDNSIYNLCSSDRRSNKVKSTKVFNSSGYRGVFKRKDRESFEVRVVIDSTDVHVGYYRNIKEAAQAYNMALDIIKDNDSYRNVVDFQKDLVNTNKTFFKTRRVVPSLE